jgi:uncharacterized membrane protein
MGAGQMITAAKTTSAIFVHMAIAFITMYVVTGSFAFGGLAAILEPICNVVVMPLHEKLWERMRDHLSSKAMETRVQPHPVALTDIRPSTCAARTAA